MKKLKKYQDIVDWMVQLGVQELHTKDLKIVLHPSVFEPDAAWGAPTDDIGEVDDDDLEWTELKITTSGSGGGEN